MFFNFSNHPSESWSDEQLQAAHQIGECDKVVDIPFPNVDPNMSELGVSRLAKQYVTMILNKLAHDDMTPCVVMAMEDFNLTYAFVNEAHRNGIRCVAGTTERNAVTVDNPDGTQTKTSTFKFVRFRAYV